jgi:DNA-binding NarL/FixJ family response regulator
MKLLLVDDHPLIRDGLLRVLAQAKPAIELLEADTWQAGFLACEAHPDLSLVLLDLNLPDRSGLDALDDLGRAFPSIPVVVLSSVDDPDVMTAALARGASGFIPKSTVGQVIFSAIQLVLAGGIYVPSQIIRTGERDSDASSHGASGQPILTERQLMVLRLVAQGKPNKLIARELDLAVGTAKIHVSNLMRALGARTRLEVVVEARKRGLLRG